MLHCLRCQSLDSKILVYEQISVYEGMAYKAELKLSLNPLLPTWGIIDSVFYFGLRLINLTLATNSVV